MIAKNDKQQNRNNKRFPRKKDGNREESEFEQKLIDLARVTRVTKGGKRLSFRACVVIGDKKNRVAYGVAKGHDVAIAINKAVAQAKKILINPKKDKGTIPHEVKAKFKAAMVSMRPAKKGRGIIAGGAVRAVLELAGYEDVVAKIIGSNNKINNVKATYNALANFK